MQGKLFKVATAIIVILLLMRPDTIMLALFLDGIGLELFLLLVGIQFRFAFAFTWSYIQPVWQKLESRILNKNSFYFRPTLQSIKSYPSMLCHSFFGYGNFLNTIWIIRGQPRCF